MSSESIRGIAPVVDRRVLGAIRNQVALYAGRDREEIGRRIARLEQEWDIERWLEAGAAALSVLGLLRGARRRRRGWFLLTGSVLGFLLQEAYRGWGPPASALRFLGVRTRREIELERYALKVLRGDFEGLPAEAENGTSRVDLILDAVLRG
jgi:hypothetical protein